MLQYIYSKCLEPTILAIPGFHKYGWFGSTFELPKVLVTIPDLFTFRIICGINPQATDTGIDQM